MTRRIVPSPLPRWLDLSAPAREKLAASGLVTQLGGWERYEDAAHGQEPIGAPVTVGEVIARAGILRNPHLRAESDGHIVWDGNIRSNVADPTRWLEPYSLSMTPTQGQLYVAPNTPDFFTAALADFVGEREGQVVFPEHPLARPEEAPEGAALPVAATSSLRTAQSLSHDFLQLKLHVPFEHGGGKRHLPHDEARRSVDASARLMAELSKQDIGLSMMPEFAAVLDDGSAEAGGRAALVRCTRPYPFADPDTVGLPGYLLAARDVLSPDVPSWLEGVLLATPPEERVTRYLTFEEAALRCFWTALRDYGLIHLAPHGQNTHYEFDLDGRWTGRMVWSDLEAVRPWPHDPAREKQAPDLVLQHSLGELTRFLSTMREGVAGTLGLWPDRIFGVNPPEGTLKDRSVRMQEALLKELWPNAVHDGDYDFGGVRLKYHRVFV